MTKEQYLSNLDYLPDFMKDFHDQKDLFKSIFDQYRNGNAKELLERVNWVDAHCFTIDVFLWWMAENGYKLQKIRKSDVKFDNAEETIKHFTDIRRTRSAAIFKEIIS